MEHQAFERLLAEHCAPTLLSRKCASLVTLSRKTFPDLSFLPVYFRTLRRIGIESRILCSCRQRVLLFLYRPDQLSQRLSDAETRNILESLGYPCGSPLSAMLSALSGRLRAHCGSFPHEIGLFLDYPPKDVSAFMHCNGAGFRLCGYWKVYTDIDSARRRFALYDRCRDILTAGLQNGSTLSALLEAA